MSDIPINEPDRYVRQLQDRIRDQRELLDECERALSGILSELTPYHFKHPFNHAYASDTLAKIRGQEQADA